MRAAIMVGGKGTRLAPLTVSFPKPLMPIGNKPILELIINQLRKYGFDDICLCTGYLSHLIEAYFGDGSDLGVHITYVHEDQPLGTAGPLSLVPLSLEPILVMNGDVLTTLNFADLYRHHVRSAASMTIALHNKRVKVDLGVLRTGSDMEVVEWQEKPEFEYQVCMGIYMLDPYIHSSIGRGKRLDIPELVARQLSAGRRVQGYRFDGYWLDIGRLEDYQKACDEWRTISPCLGEEAGDQPAGNAVTVEEVLAHFPTT
jgi:NDP-mannose synthase